MNEYQLAAALWLIVVGATAALPFALAVAGAVHGTLKEGHRSERSDPSLPSIPSCPSSAG